MSDSNLTLPVALITALVPLFGIFMALISVRWQMKRQWLLHSATLITSLDDRFNSTEWREYRKQCAEKLKDYRFRPTELDLSENFPVLPFFENLGYLVRSGALDQMMVWNKFGRYVVGYYLALTTSKDVIQEVRQKTGDSTLWEEFEWLSKECIKIYQNKGIKFEDKESRDDKITALLKWESTLVISSSNSNLMITK